MKKRKKHGISHFAHVDIETDIPSLGRDAIHVINMPEIVGGFTEIHDSQRYRDYRLAIELEMYAPTIDPNILDTTMAQYETKPAYTFTSTLAESKSVSRNSVAINPCSLVLGLNKRWHHFDKTHARVSHQS